MSPPPKFSEQLATLCDVARQVAQTAEADSLLLLLETPQDWVRLRQATEGLNVLLAADRAADLAGAADAGFSIIQLVTSDSPVYEQLTRALLESVADDLLNPAATVVAMYSGFEAGVIDSLSVIQLDEHLGRLTAQDLRQLETRVPLDTLKTAVDLAVSIGREGREGKPVGTLFVVGDHRTVLKHCHPLGFDPVKGYGTHERQLNDSKVREAIKEIAQLDGAFIVASDGTVVAAGRRHHAEQGARHAALGGSLDQPRQPSDRYHGERIKRHGPLVPERRSDVAHRTVPSRDEVARLRIRSGRRRAGLASQLRGMLWPLRHEHAEAPDNLTTST